MIIFVLCMAILSVSIFLFANQPTDVDKISMDYGEVLDVELLQENATSKFKDTYDIIKTYASDMRGVIHCFGYEKEVAFDYINNILLNQQTLFKVKMLCLEILKHKKN